MSNYEQIKETLEALESEVNDLHPVLESLFNSMQSIQSCEYTHGPHEKGADFILSKISQEIGDLEYVGVVVKKGGISKNDRDCFEQVDECQQERYVEGGKKKIFLHEIWVLCNGRISENAKQRINHKYNTAKVKFIAIDKLTELVVEYLPDYSTTIRFADAEFLKQEQSIAIELEANTSLLPGENNVYLEQDLVKVTYDEYGNIERQKKPMEILNAINDSDAIFIEGEMGGGKSKLIIQLIKQLTDQQYYLANKILPIQIKPIDLGILNFDVEQIIEEVIQNAGLSADSSRNYLLVIDGLDEVEKEGNTIEENVKNIISFVNSSSHVKAMFTSRPIKSNELLQTARHTSTFRLAPLSMNKIITFLQKACSSAQIETRLLEDLKGSQLFRELPNTPISAILLANMINEGIDELPSGITDLYSKYCELALGRWDISKGIFTQKEYSAADAILGNLAEYFMGNSLSQIATTEAISFFESYLNERNLDLDASSLFNNIVKRSGLVYTDPRAETFGFKHRSFLQYFYAKYMRSQGEIVLDEHIYHPYWFASYFFLFGLLEDCPELLNAARNVPIPDKGGEGFRFGRLTSYGSLMLAAYRSPYQEVKDGINFAFNEAAALFRDVIEKPNDHSLSRFPELQLLSLFRSIMQQEYSFSFFKEAIEERLLSLELDNANAHEIFLLDVAHEELTGETIFCDRITADNADIPLSIQLALKVLSEKKSDTYSSTPIKKLVKKFGKRLRGSEVFKQAIDKIAYHSVDGKIDVSKRAKQRSALPNSKKRESIRRQRN